METRRVRSCWNTRCGCSIPHCWSSISSLSASISRSRTVAQPLTAWSATPPQRFARAGWGSRPARPPPTGPPPRRPSHAVAESAFRTAANAGARVFGGPKWTVSPVYEGMLKEEMDEPPALHPDVDYRPVLIDATYAGLLSGATDAPLV